MFNSTAQRCGFNAIYLSLLTFVTSLCLPVVPDKNGDLFGYEVFYLSMLSAFSKSVATAFPPPFLLWCANVSWLIGLICFFKCQKGWSISLAFVSAVLSSLWLHKALMFGYYLWLASMYLFLLASVIQWASPREAFRNSNKIRTKVGVKGRTSDY